MAKTKKTSAPKSKSKRHPSPVASPNSAGPSRRRWLCVPQSTTTSSTCSIGPKTMEQIWAATGQSARKSIPGRSTRRPGPAEKESQQILSRPRHRDLPRQHQARIPGWRARSPDGRSSPSLDPAFPSCPARPAGNRRQSAENRRRISSASSLPIFSI